MAASANRPRPRRRPRRTPAGSDIPSTVLRSDEHAQAIWAKTHDAAVDTYGEGERAHRTAFASLKHSYEKVADHWERKARRGPSDGPAARSTATGSGEEDSEATAGGVDTRAPMAHLRELAARLEIRGRSKMNKAALIAAIRAANDRMTARARAPRRRRTP